MIQLHAILGVLGKGHPSGVILSSLALAIIILFYILSVTSYFKPDVYRFDDRITYHQYFHDRYIFDMTVDNLIINSAFLVWIYLSFIRHIKWFVLMALTSLCVAGAVVFSPSLNQIISLFSLPFIFSIRV